ncbi:exportin-4-like [Schistocerca gregaria]|uniref:exportin-4-like n=1 Tax=Schistocerca gregaria TaxID=7010 RepID=UPI00211DE83D|nr:exportin-4-like [Schistocerca gregaria]
MLSRAAQEEFKANFERACEACSKDPIADNERAVVQLKTSEHSLEMCQYILGNTTSPYALFYGLLIFESVVRTRIQMCVLNAVDPFRFLVDLVFCRSEIFSFFLLARAVRTVVSIVSCDMLCQWAGLGAGCSDLGVWVIQFLSGALVSNQMRIRTFALMVVSELVETLRAEDSEKFQSTSFFEMFWIQTKTALLGGVREQVLQAARDSELPLDEERRDWMKQGVNACTSLVTWICTERLVQSSCEEDNDSAAVGASVLDEYVNIYKRFRCDAELAEVLQEACVLVSNLLSVESVFGYFFELGQLPQLTDRELRRWLQMAASMLESALELPRDRSPWPVADESTWCQFASVVALMTTRGTVVRAATGEGIGCEELRLALQCWKGLADLAEGQYLFENFFTEIFKNMVDFLLDAPTAAPPYRSAKLALNSWAVCEDLTNLAHIGRFSFVESARVLTRSIQSACQNVRSSICSLVEASAWSADASREVDRRLLGVNLERMCWLVMASGYFLCDISPGECVSAPCAVGRLRESELSAMEELVEQVFACSRLEDQWLEARRGECSAVEWSSDVGQVIAWFISYYAPVYLVSESGVCASDPASRLEWCFEKVRLNLNCWYDQEDVVLATCDILGRLDMADRELLGRTLARVRNLEALFDASWDWQRRTSLRVQKKWISSLVNFCFNDEKAVQRRHLELVFRPIACRLERIWQEIQSCGEARGCSASYAEEVQCVLTQLRGFEACYRSSLSDQCAHLILDYFPVFPKLAQIFASFPVARLVFGLFADFSAYLLPMVEESARCAVFYSSAESLLELYRDALDRPAQILSGFLQLTQEEEAQQRLSLLKKFVRLMDGVAATRGEYANRLVQLGATALERAFSTSLLQNPPLCKNYFAFFLRVIECPRFVESLGDASLARIVDILDCGLCSSDEHVVAKSLESIKACARATSRGAFRAIQERRTVIAKCARCVLERLLLESWRKDLIQLAAAALAALVRAEREAVFSALEAFVAGQDERIRSKLEWEARRLLDGAAWSARDLKLEPFAYAVRGALEFVNAL